MYSRAETGPTIESPWLLHPAETSGRQSGQGYIFSLVNHTHPAPAELLDDAIMRNGLTDQTGNSSLRGSNLRSVAYPSSIAANGVQQANSPIHRMNVPIESKLVGRDQPLDFQVAE
jgi:hypothetical protein